MEFPHLWLGQKVDAGAKVPNSNPRTRAGGVSPPRSITQSVTQWVPCRFYEKVQALHQDPEASVDNPLLAFSLIKRLHSDWPNVVYSDEATENTQGMGGVVLLSVLSVTWGEPGGDRDQVEEQEKGW